MYFNMPLTMYFIYWLWHICIRLSWAQPNFLFKFIRDMYAAFLFSCLFQLNYLSVIQNCMSSRRQTNVILHGL